MRERESGGATCVLLALGPSVVAAFAITDPLKPEAVGVVAALRASGLQVTSQPQGVQNVPVLVVYRVVYSARPLACIMQSWHGLLVSLRDLTPCVRLLEMRLATGLTRLVVRQCHMVTGDNWTTARVIADRVGILNVMAEVQPDGKAEQVLCLICTRPCLLLFLGIAFRAMLYIHQDWAQKTLYSIQQTYCGSCNASFKSCGTFKLQVALLTHKPSA